MKLVASLTEDDLSEDWLPEQDFATWDLRFKVWQAFHNGGYIVGTSIGQSIRQCL